METKKLALVTGASRGIGRAIAEMLASRNIIVVGTATSDEGAKAITDYLASAGAQGFGIRMDVCDEASITEVFATIDSRFQQSPTILVNNAGITKDNLLLRMKDDEWDQVIQTNLTGVFKVSRKALKPMVKARWGRIIHIGSVSGVMGNPGQVNYAAAKAGLIGMSKSLAKEVASRGITVNVVAPGFVDTDMVSHFKPEEIDALTHHIPIGRFARPQEIAAAVAFLASDEAAYITGETIHINGGLHMA